jgi:hypothetical protein
MPSTAVCNFGHHIKCENGNAKDREKNQRTSFNHARSPYSGPLLFVEQLPAVEHRIILSALGPDSNLEVNSN